MRIEVVTFRKLVLAGLSLTGMAACGSRSGGAPPKVPVSVARVERRALHYELDATGDGEFKSKTRFDGSQLIVEDDFGGPKLTTTYTPMLDGGEILRLVVTLKPENLPDEARERLERRGGRTSERAAHEVTRTYDADRK